MIVTDQEMPRRPVLDNSTNAQSEKPGYGTVMLFYLVTGTGVSLYFIFYFVFLWLWGRGSLPAESLVYFLLYGLPGLIFSILFTYGWLFGIFLIVRYRHSWRVVVPATALTAVGLFSFFGKFFLFVLMASITNIALVSYLIAASLVGIEWLASKILHSRYGPPAA